MSNLTIYLAMLMLGSNFSSTTTANQPTAVFSVKPVDEEQRFVDLVNYERWSRGLPTLSIDPLLIEVARGHSKEMAEKSYFDHISPTVSQRTAMDRYLTALGDRPQWALLGENLSYCSIVDVNRSHTSLMESQSHRENILNPRFDRIGIGVYTSEDGQFWVTEMFLSEID